MTSSTRVAHRQLPAPPIDSDIAALYGITDVQAQALALVATGRTDQQCADELKIHLSTFKARVRAAFTKLRLSDRAAVTLYCSVTGIFLPYPKGLPARFLAPFARPTDPRQRPPRATFNSALAFEIQELRMARNMDREQLATLTGIPAGTIRAYESGRPITTDRLQLLCRALGVRQDALIQLADARLLLQAMRTHVAKGNGALAKVNLHTDEIENYEDGDDAEQYG